MKIKAIETKEKQEGRIDRPPARAGILRNCDYCGKVYQARRSSSRFCSSTCRVHAWQAERLTAADPEAE